MISEYLFYYTYLLKKLSHYLLYDNNFLFSYRKAIKSQDNFSNNRGLALHFIRRKFCLNFIIQSTRIQSTLFMNITDGINLIAIDYMFNQEEVVKKEETDDSPLSSLYARPH